MQSRTSDSYKTKNLDYSVLKQLTFLLPVEIQLLGKDCTISSYEQASQSVYIAFHTTVS